MMRGGGNSKSKQRIVVCPTPVLCRAAAGKRHGLGHGVVRASEGRLVLLNLRVEEENACPTGPYGEEGGPRGFPNLLKEEEQEEDKEEKKEDDDDE